jgi:hypothetical protein
MLSKIRSLGAQRDSLATTIKGELVSAAFDNVPLPGQVTSQISGCERLIGEAEQLAGL